jgi:hypothetical protein
LGVRRLIGGRWTFGGAKGGLRKLRSAIPKVLLVAIPTQQPSVQGSPERHDGPAGTLLANAVYEQNAKIVVAWSTAIFTIHGCPLTTTERRQEAIFSQTAG